MQVEEHDGYVTIILPEVVGLDCAHELKEALQSLYDKGYNIIEVDCNRLTMISTAGISGFVVFQKKLKERGGELKIVHVNNDYIKYLFDRIDLSRVICIERVDTVY